MSHIIFLIQGPDQPGLVSKISTFFYSKGLNILNCQEHVDELLQKYFMRVKLSGVNIACSRQLLEEQFADFAQPLALSWSVSYTDVQAKVAIMATQTTHCLYDLLVRHEQGELNCDVRLVIANSPVLESVADKFKIPYHCLPVVKNADPQVYQEARRQHEQAVIELLRQHHIDLTILARYMLILSPEFIDQCKHPIINVHHAILPAFKGARPYQRAYQRGVKMIGATAHYATQDLDEGPIIEQDVERVTHEQSAKHLVNIGADIERIVLARAVKAHLEDRIIIDGNRTIVFT